MDLLGTMAVFGAVVDAGSLSAGGRRLGMPLPTVSRRISELEAHVGARLLVRSTRALELTDAGESYLAACRRILEDVAEAGRLAAGEYREPKGDLTITAPIVFGRLHVLPVVTEFLRAYPHVDVRLQLGDRDLNLLEEHIDAAVRVGPLPDSALVAARIGMIRTVVCAGSDYLRARGTPKRPGDLEQHDCILFDRAGGPSSWAFAGVRSTADVPIRARLVVNTAEAAVDAAIAGTGVTRVYSYQAARAVREGALSLILRKFEPPGVPVSLVHTGQRRLPLKLRAFLDFAGPRLRSRLSST